jgi:hypothetical protein
MCNSRNYKRKTLVSLDFRTSLEGTLNQSLTVLQLKAVVRQKEEKIIICGFPLFAQPLSLLLNL